MLTSEYATVKQSGNGVAVAFDFAFKILAASDLVVTKFDANNNQGVPLILGTDYTVVFDPIAETGTVTYTVAPVSGGASNIARVSDNTQQTSLPREGPMPAKTVETMIDKLTMLLQENQAAIDAAVFSQIFQLFKVGTFAVLDAAAGATPFLAIVTDNRTISVYLGNRGLGQNGWTTLGGF